MSDQGAHLFGVAGGQLQADHCAGTVAEDVRGLAGGDAHGRQHAVGVVAVDLDALRRPCPVQGAS